MALVQKTIKLGHTIILKKFVIGMEIYRIIGKKSPESL